MAFWAGAMGGAALSANLSGTWGGERGVAPLVGFLGGAFMLFGARMASGCTRYCNRKSLWCKIWHEVILNVKLMGRQIL